MRQCSDTFSGTYFSVAEVSDWRFIYPSQGPFYAPAWGIAVFAIMHGPAKIIISNTDPFPSFHMDIEALFMTIHLTLFGTYTYKDKEKIMYHS